MQILITIAIAAPVLVILAVLKALKHTRIDSCPTALKSSFMNFNEDDSHHLVG
ncbi:MAG: hypothetical protein HN366_24580 [Deltaproteobacteria bacterium]|nr:hypothetical protein [Deltaproteobacteria bacterium]